MKRKIAILAGSVLLVLAAQTSVATSAENTSPCDKDSDEARAQIALITRMEHERVQAGVRKDTAVVSSMTAKGFVQIDFDGRLLDQAATAERIKGSGIRLQSNSIDDVAVRICGDTAIVTGRAHPKGVFNNQDFSPTIRYSRVYLRRDGQWRAILFQQTRVVGDP